MSKVTDFILESIENIDGDLNEYTDLAKENVEAYRSFDEYISSHIDKTELAKRLGLTSTRAFKEWAENGIKFPRALECAIAMKLDLEEANEFFSKYSGMRSLYPAGKQDFRRIYVLIYRERLEKQFPYEENESVKDWIQRIFPQLEFVAKAEKKAEEESRSPVKDTRISTKTYLDALMEQDLDLLPKIRFRSAGEKALAYLDELVKDTPFEKNHGNRSSGNENILDVNERNGSIRKDHFEEEEKGHYRLLRDKLNEGDIPHRDELIEFAMSMTLGLKKEQVDQLLIKSGYKPLQARNLYEGLLITLYRHEERVEAGEIDSDTDYEDFQVFVSEKVDEALAYLPEAEHLLKEVPKWYLDEPKRKKRLEKRCFSTVISRISVKMTRTWIVANRKKISEISKSTLRKAALNPLLELQNIYLDKNTFQKVFDIILRTEARWVELVNSQALAGLKHDPYLALFKDVLQELNDYYSEIYAPKKKRSEKKGQKGGRGRHDN